MRAGKVAEINDDGMVERFQDSFNVTLITKEEEEEKKKSYMGYKNTTLQLNFNKYVFF